MLLARTLLLSSLALNLVLAFVVLRPSRSAPAAASPRPASPTAPTPTPLAWSTLPAHDLPALVTALRAAGLPARLVRAIVNAQLAQEFEARRKALDPEGDARPFWKYAGPNPAIQPALRRLHYEQQKALRTLLGPDAELDDPWSRVARQRQLAGLPPDRAAALQQINDAFNDRYFELSLHEPGRPPGNYAALRQEHENAIARLLTPAERELHDFHASPTAQNLRERLRNFDTTEQEFRGLYRLQRAYDDRFERSAEPVANEAETRLRNDARQELQAQIKALLGPDRFAAYERAIDYSYQHTARLVARLELPPASTEQIWSVQKDIQARAKIIRDDAALPEPDRAARLTALAAEATEKLTPHLGARGLEAYKDNGGTWLVELTVPRAQR